MPELTRLLESAVYIPGEDEAAPISFLEAAMFWPPGFDALLSARVNNTAQALETALYFKNRSSVEALIRSGVSLDQAEVLHSAIGSSDDCQALVIDELKKRRDQLRDLASQWLTRTEQQELGYDPGKTLDSRAFVIYCQLRSRGIPVPEGLNPGATPLFFVGSWPSTFYPSLQKPREKTFFFEKLLAAGFTDLDEGNPEDSQVTPLLSIAHSFMETCGTPGTLDTIIAAELLWLVKNGASCEFAGERSSPNLLFYLLSPFVNLWFARATDIIKENLALLRHLLGHVTSCCDPMQPDSCQCFCSPGGCLPVRQLACCGGPCFHYQCGWAGRNRQELDQGLLAALEACGMDGSPRAIYIERTVRLETFERLGMAHTCCSLSNYDPLARRIPFRSQSVREELQDEDAGLKEQLELIMEAFAQFQSTFSGSEAELLAHWWGKLDMILPEQDPADRCRGLVSREKEAASGDERSEKRQNERAALEERSLQENGYAGKDFIDVISLHFQQYLAVAN